MSIGLLNQLNSIHPEKIDFGRIDFVELILVKSELNVKLFMFGYLQNKSDLYEKCCLDVLSQNCF